MKVFCANTLCRMNIKKMFGIVSLLLHLKLTILIIAFPCKVFIKTISYYLQVKLTISLLKCKIMYSKNLIIAF